MRVLVIVAAMVALAVCWTTSARAQIPAFWYRLATCETGHLGPGYPVVPRWNWGAEHRPGEGKEYEGGLGFYWSTWRLWAGELGLLKRYPHAYLAPAVVQVRVGEYGLARGGYWGCLRRGNRSRGSGAETRRAGRDVIPPSLRPFSSFTSPSENG